MDAFAPPSAIEDAPRNARKILTMVIVASEGQWACPELGGQARGGNTY
jgi:hypothetical protein